MTTLFLSYARGDDEPFVKRPYENLAERRFLEAKAEAEP